MPTLSPQRGPATRRSSGAASWPLSLSQHLILGERQRYAKGLVKSTNPCRLQAGDVVREYWLGNADEAVTVDARFVLQAFLGTDVDLSGQAVAASVDRCADDRGEP